MVFFFDVCLMWVVVVVVCLKVVAVVLMILLLVHDGSEFVSYAPHNRVYLIIYI